VQKIFDEEKVYKVKIEKKKKKKKGKIEKNTISATVSRHLDSGTRCSIGEHGIFARFFNQKKTQHGRKEKIA
jgi:hypothetical protein